MASCEVELEEGGVFGAAVADVNDAEGDAVGGEVVGDAAVTSAGPAGLAEVGDEDDFAVGEGGGLSRVVRMASKVAAQLFGGVGGARGWRRGRRIWRHPGGWRL